MSHIENMTELGEIMMFDTPWIEELSQLRSQRLFDTPFEYNRTPETNSEVLPFGGIGRSPIQNKCNI